MAEDNVNSSLQAESNVNLKESPKIPVDSTGGPIGGYTPTDINGVSVDFDSIKDELFIPNSGEPITTSIDPTEITNANALANSFTYNPVSMNYPYDMDPNSKLFEGKAPEEKNAILGSIFEKYSDPSANQRLTAGGAKGLQPLKFDAKATNYDRYNAPGFKQLFNDIGFHPYVDNETIYNANSTWWDENARMRGQFGRIFSTGYMSTYDAIGDAINGNYMSGDTDGASVFEDAMRIGNSSKEGLGSFFNNLMLNSGYTFGILSNIAVEELALAGLEAVSFGGATPLVASRTAYNMVRGAKAVDKSIDMAKGAKHSKSLLDKVNNQSRAYDFWRAGGRWALNTMTPSTFKAVREINTTANTAKALSLMAKTAKTAGGFYRDLRAVNLAMSESKLEAGMVENNLYNNLYNEYVAKYGSRPLGKQLENIKQTAAEASFTTLMWNFPVIFFSNQIVLGTALRGFKGVGGVFNKAVNTSSTGRRIIEKSAKQLAKETAKDGAKVAFTKGSASALSRIFERGIVGNFRQSAGSFLNYSSANLAEGFQELAQESIAVGAEDYYKNLYNDPAMGGIDAQMASIYSGVNSQMSGQGFEVFMSGFLMGGLVQGPQKLVFNTLPSLYNKAKDPEAYKQYLKDEETYLDESVKTLNEMYNDPETYFDPNRINAILQKQASQNMFDSTYRGEVLPFQDQKDEAIFHALYTAASLNKLGDFSKMFSDLSAMDNERLAEAMPEQSPEDIESGKTRNRLSSMVTRSEEMRKSYEKLNDQIIDPYDPSKFKKGSKEYIDEGIRKAAFNHAKMLALFARDAFSRSLERINSIYTELSSDPIVSNMAANEINILTDMSALISEINLLKTEIQVATANQTIIDENGKEVSVPQQLSGDEKALLKEKQERLELVQNIFSVLTDPNNVDVDTKNANAEKIIDKLRNDILSESSDRDQTDEFIATYSGQSNPFGTFNNSNSEKFKEAALSYFQFLSKKDGIFINSDALDATIEKILDSKSLGTKSEILNRAISTILNPGNLIELSQRFEPRFKQMFENNKTQVLDRLKKYVDTTKKNTWLNELSAIGVYPEITELDFYLKNKGPIPQTYYTDNGILKESDTQYNKAQAIIGTQENITPKKEKPVETVKAKEETDDYDYEDSFLDENIDDIEIEENKVLGNLFVKQQWLNYTSKQVQNNKKHLSFEEWVKDPASKKARVQGVAIDEIDSKIYKPLVFASLNTKEKVDPFYKWLSRQGGNEKVLDIINLYNVSLFELTDGVQPGELNKSNIKKSDEVTVDPKKSGVNVTERTVISKTGKKEKIYINTDNNNNLIDDKVYPSKSKASKARDAKVKTKSEDKTLKFAGQTFKAGSLLTKDGKEYVVKSTQKTIDDNNNLFIKDVSKKSSRKQSDNIFLSPKDFADYTIVTAESVTYNKSMSRLKINEATKVNPTYDYSISNRTEQVEEGVNNQQKLLRNITPEGLANMSIRISRGPKFGKERTDNKFSIGKQEENPNLIKNAQKFSVEIYNSQGSFGYFQGPETVLLTNESNVVISPLELTQSDIEQYFELPRSYDGNKINIAEATEVIKSNYAQAYHIYNMFEKELLNSDIIEKSIGSYPELMLTLSEGSITSNKDNPLIHLDELETMFVSDDTTNTLDGQKPYYIMDYNRTYIRPSKKGGLMKVQGAPITNIDQGSDFFTQIEDKVSLYESKYDVANRLGKYIAFVTLPNGKSAFIPLAAPVMEPEVFNELLVKMQERANKLLDTNVNEDGTLIKVNQTTEINELINSKLFLAAEPGVYIDLNISNDGQLVVKYTNMNLSKKNKKRQAIGYIGNSELKEFKDITDVVARLNTFIKPVYSKGFTINDFKVSVEKQQDDIGILGSLQTKFLPEIKTNFNLELKVNPNLVSIAQITRSLLTENTKNKLEVNDDTVDLTIDKEEKRSIVKKDYKNVDPKVSLNIVRKYVKGQELDEFEQEVYDALEDDVRAALTLTVMGEKNSDLTNTASLLNQQYQGFSFKAEERIEDFENRYWQSRFDQIKASNSEITDDQIIDLVKNELIDIETNPLNPLNSRYVILKKLKEDADGKAFKITDKFDGNAIEDIETYTNWIKTNLNTEFVSLNLDIDNLQNNLVEGQMLMGQFLLHQHNLKFAGEITVGTNNPFKYHEAFHAVFRMFLTEKEIKNYLKLSKKDALAKLRKEGKNLSDELSLMRKTHAMYAQMSRTQLEERFIEEYMADEFENFKMNPSNSSINTETKSLFRKLIDLLLSLFNFPTSTLNSLFTNIDSGKFKNAGVQENRFTTAASKAPSVALKASLKLGTRKIKTIKDNSEYIKTINNYMPADHQHVIISGITNLYLRRKNNSDAAGTDKNIILDGAVNDFIEMYDPNRKFYKDKGIIWYKDNFRKIENYNNSLIQQKSEIKEAVNQRLADIDTSIILGEFDINEVEADLGDITTEQWEKMSEEIGGFGSAPKLIRQIFSTVTIADQDMFGNKNISENNTEPIEVGVNYTKVYDSILKAVANQPNPVKMLQQLWVWSQGGNVETKAVVNEIFRQTGYYDKAVSGELFNPEQPFTEPDSVTGLKNTLFQMFTKQFENYYVPYDLQFKDKETGVVHIYAANKADDSHYTLTQWAESFNRKYDTIRIVGSKENKNAAASLKALSQFVSLNNIPKNINLVDRSVSISEDVYESTGMKFDSNYILFSLLNRLSDKQVELNVEQSILKKMNQFADPLLSEEINIILISLNTGENLFLDNQSIQEDDSQAEMTDVEFYKGGVKGRLRKIALNNSYFDENVGASTFINEEGNRIYSHQRSTLHLQEIARMSTEDNYLASKLAEDPFLEDNFLVNDIKFKSMLENGEVLLSRQSGSKEGVLNLTAEGILKENKGFNKSNAKGTKFGSLNPQDFIASLINSYTRNYNRIAPNKSKIGSYIDPVTNKPVSFAISPSFIRVIEASNTGESVTLPVHKMIQNNVSIADFKIIDGVISNEIDESAEGSITLTQEAFDAFEKIIKRDVKLIQNELDEETRTEDDVVGGNSDKFGTRTNTGRLYQLSHNGKKILSKLKRRKRNISVYSDPNLGEDTKKAIRTGKQKVMLSTTSDASSTQLVSTGDKGLVDFGIGNQAFFTMTNRGRLNISDMSMADVKVLIEQMGPYILTSKANRKKMFSFKIGETLYYTYSKNVQSFFKGNESLVKFDFVDSLNDIESDVKINTDSSTGQVTMDMDILDTSPAETFEQLINEGVSYEEAMKAVDGKILIENRLFDEVNEFKELLKDFAANNKISSDITNGLGVILDSESGKVINDIDVEETSLYMDLYNLKYDDYDYNVTQIFLNDYINTLSFNEFILGDQRLSFKDGIEAIKRAKMQNAAGKSADSMISAPQLGVMHASKNIDMLLHEDSLYQREFEKIFPRDQDLDSEPGERGDGQVFITTKAARYWKFSFGELTPQVARIMDLIEVGNEVELNKEFFGSLNTESYKQLGAIMNSQKLVYGDGKVYIKMSAFTLTPLFTSLQDKEGNWTIPIDGRESLHNLRIKLEKWESNKDTVAMAVPMSASKMLKQNVLDNSSAFDTSEVQERNMTRLDAKYMRLQMVNPSNKIEIVDPRQIKNIITSEQDLNQVVLLNGKETTVGKVINLYHEAQTNKLAVNWFAKRNLVYDFDKIHNEFLNPVTAKGMTINLSAFLKFAIAGLESAQSKQDMLSYFSMNENGTGEPEFNLNNQLTRSKFQSLFLSYVSKGVLSSRQPGTSLALVTDDGFNVIKKAIDVDDNGTPTRWEVIRRTDWLNIKSKGNVAKRYTNSTEETHAGVRPGEYYIDRLRADVMEYDENNKPTGITYTEFVMPPHFKSILSNVKPGQPITEVISKAFGIRIPSQDKHSSVNLRVVDFMPVYYGSSAIFARELVELSGADFDIDKLYAQFKDFFYDGENFVEYGKAKTESAKYNQYIRWATEQAKTKGKPIREAVEMYLDSATEPITFNLSEWNNMSSEELDILNNSEKIVADVMSATLGLPVSQIEYNKYKEEFNGREPYDAPHNNDILDYKYILQGNPGMTKSRDGREKGIAQEPANIRPLSDALAAKVFGSENAGVWDYIKSELPLLAEVVSEEDIDIDNFRGKLLSFKANKEGSKSIGAVVSPNSVVNIAKEFQTNLRSEKDADGRELIVRLKVNDIEYSEFVDYSINPKTGKVDNEGYRTQYIISALITAMTDNAKERLADKLGLNKNALAMVTTMTAMGVDIKTSILIINQPAIRANFFNAINKQDSSDPGIRSLLVSRLAQILLFFEGQDLSLDRFKTKLTTDYLQTKANDVYSYNAGLDFSESEINDEVLNDLAQEELLINQFLTVYDQTEFLRNVSVLLNIQKGLGQDLYDVTETNEAAKKLGLTMTDKQWIGNAKNPNLMPFDFRPVFTQPTKEKKSFHATNYSIFRENNDYLFPKTFLEASADFIELKNLMVAQMINLNTKKDQGVLVNNITSYLNTVAYLRSYIEVSNKEINGTDRQTTSDSLNNNLIYDPSNFGGSSTSSALTITKVLNNILANKKGYNYFIDDFIALNKASNEDNYTGIDKLSTNNFTQLNDAEISNIQNSFLELYSDPATHHDSISLIHYLLVKDGFNINTRGTYLSLVPSELKKGILNSIDAVQTLFNSEIRTDEAYKRIFGMTKSELKNDLVTNYLKSSSAQYHVSQIDTGKEKLQEIFKIETENVEIKEGSLTILPYPENTTIVTEDSSESSGLDITAPRKFKYKNINFYSVEHAYETNKSGKLDKKLHKQYLAKKDNIGGVSIKGAGNGNLRLLSSLTKLSLLQNLTGENKYIGLRDYGTVLISYSDFNSVHLKADVNDAYITGIKQAQKEIIYTKLMYGENQGDFIFGTRSTTNNKDKQDLDSRNNAIVVDVDKGLVTLKLYNGIGTTFNDKIKTAKGVNNVVQNKENQSLLRKNIKELKDKNIQTIILPIKTSQNKTVLKQQMILPIITRKQMKDGRIVILELIKYQRDGIYEKNSDMNSIIPDENNYVFGNYAQYLIREEGPLRSKDQNPIGFLFGNGPSLSAIEKFEEQKRDAFDFDIEEDVSVEEFDDEGGFEETSDVTGDSPSLLGLMSSKTSIQDELAITKDDLVSSWYDSLSTEDKEKIGSKEDIMDGYLSYPIEAQEYIENIKKCYLK